jgi:sarcosine oxidase subunit beta
MTEAVDVAVVGGGVIGLSCARELRRAGGGRVVVLEREPSVGQGSSSRANGGVRAQFTTPVNVAFSLHSIAELERLRERHRELLSFHQTGYLFLAGTEARERWLHEAMSVQRSLGVATEWIEPHDVHALAPLVRLDGLRGATFHTRDGFLDPHGLTEAMRLESRSEGAEIRTGVEVTGIDARGAGFAIHTTGDAIEASWVVNAAGPFARRVASMVGVDIPVEPVRRNLAFVHVANEPMGLIPMCVDLDTGVLVRREVGGGYVISYSNPEDPPGWETSVDPRFLEDVAERIGNRFPSLEGVPIDPRHCWAGLYPETPDHHAVIGETAERFVVCVGFGGHGLMHAPAAGLAVAEIVTRGRSTSFDLRALRPARFAEGDLVTESAVL